MIFLSTPAVLIAISIAISFLGTFHYVRDTIRGTTKPNRVTWFMWALAPITASVVSYFSGGDMWSALKVFSAGFFPALVFAASFYNPQAYWKLGAFDLICGALSLAALLLWLGMSQTAFAIVLAIVGDLFASLPTFTKTLRRPDTETGFAYICYALSFIPSLLALSVWNFENAAFQLYLVGLNVLLVLMVYRNRLFRRNF
ncbi:hypothetical protein HY968_00120 [Candidatus Kaiserbacteria bacterium]|nr:hypothetical protein [Candidatus Kaiserbacteria bacterium]